MRLLPISVLLLITVLSVVDARRREMPEESSEEEDEGYFTQSDGDSEWEDLACPMYDKCLHAFDDKVDKCGNGNNKEPDELDPCFVPIRKHIAVITAKRDKKSSMLRRCFLNGKVEGERRGEKDETAAGVGKRHQASCRQRFNELDQFLVTNKKSAKKAHESCQAAARRLKERCQKIESCCPRVKSCRSRVATHSITEQLRDLETIIKEERRRCKEQEFLR